MINKPKNISPPSFCNWRNKTEKPKKNQNKTKHYKYKGNFSWKGISTERYKQGDGDWSEVVRQTLIGNHGETAKFHLRYFEIATGGYSSFEMHKHEHVVIGMRGRGVCIAGKQKYRIGFLDTLYLEPNTPHQLRNPFKEPFGFFCIVNSRRDKPKILSSPSI
jgi:ribulose-bisphosphate carboxylase large chain